MLVDEVYSSLLNRILANGETVNQRAVLQSNGMKPKCLSLFGEQIKIPLASAFPLLTTKRVPFKAVVHELVWFLRGSTNIGYLKDNGVKIWDQWADENGDLGPVYQKHWRHWTRTDDATISRTAETLDDLVRSGFGSITKEDVREQLDAVDQITNLEADIRAVVENPNHHAARRMLLSSWNVGDMPDPKVPTGCHTFAQFSVRPGSPGPDGTAGPGRLACHLYMR